MVQWCKLGVLGHTFHLKMQEAKARNLICVPEVSLGYIARPCLKNKRMVWCRVLVTETGVIWMVCRITWSRLKERNDNEWYGLA